MMCHIMDGTKSNVLNTFCFKISQFAFVNIVKCEQSKTSTRVQTAIEVPIEHIRNNEQQVLN